MHIYIDESGIFRNPANKSNVASCVVALVIPTSQKVKLLGEYQRLTAGWFPAGEEVKGSRLDEQQIAEVVALLKSYDVILEITVIDLGIHSEDEITAFKKQQADNITAHVKPEFHPELRKQLNELRAAFLKMPNQLFVQAFIMFELIPHTIQEVVLYYSRRIPKELSQFLWTVDAKNDQITEFEDAWSKVIFTIIQTQSYKRPFRYVEGGDYSSFQKFATSNEEVIESVRRETKFERDEIGTLELKELLGRSFKFQNSKDKPGLQVADILANATQRAF